MFYEWILVQIKHLLKQLKKVHLVEHILETCILVLMGSGIFPMIFHGSFFQLKDIDQKYYFSIYYEVSVNKYGVKCGHRDRRKR